MDAGAAVPDMLKTARAEEVQIEQIVLTHAHLDHVDGVARAKLETSAPILLHRDDQGLYQAAPAQAQWFGIQVEIPPPVDGYLEDGQTIQVGKQELLVRHTPGHAPGHVVLIGDGLAFVGDCVFAGSIGRTDLPGGDFQQLMASIRTHILPLPDETVLYSGHGPETTAGRERLTNPFLVPDFGGRGFA